MTTDASARLGSGSAEALVMSYEGLRRDVLAGCSGSRTLGEGLLVSRGMAVWMRAWANVPPVQEARESHPCGAHGPVPGTVRGEIVVILARMALGAR